jgi:type II secretory pathway component GspD/PulD (secretin)
VTVIVAVVLLATGAMGQTTDEEPPRLKVTGAKEQLTVQATDVPLGELLTEVGRVAGITVVLDNALTAEEAARPVSATFDNVTPDEAFRRLLRGYHAVYRYAGESAGLTSITVYGPAIPARSGFAPPPRAREQPATPPNAEQLAEALRRLADRNDPAARDAAVEILARATQPELI